VEATIFKSRIRIIQEVQEIIDLELWQQRPPSKDGDTEQVTKLRTNTDGMAS
jgi:hypothetical protein